MGESLFVVIFTNTLVVTKSLISSPFYQSLYTHIVILILLYWQYDFVQNPLESLILPLGGSTKQRRMQWEKGWHGLGLQQR